ncbi:ribonuclease HII [Cellulomonas fimi]|uniref:Ribonuclease n=1 Tax=Cellulomonas fimi TaxID=1708 RepID=A0A7Y0QG04_CELFI|nr:ribonuclease HII [Cellulomonas fimi]NMR19591.1 ribonuclease HII [Cellulomonas fimi]
MTTTTQDGTALDRARQARRAATPTRSTQRRTTPTPTPTLRRERALLGAGAALVVGMDEVGRGALAGPVSVGAVAVGATTRTCPRGVADSKLLTPAARTALLPSLSRWGLARAVGHASAAEIDAFGIIAALRLAGRRALAEVVDALGPVDAVLLDGSHDWLSAPRQGRLFEGSPDGVASPDGVTELGPPLAGLGRAAVEAPQPRVHLLVKADRTCASVAAASILAKCERDALMASLAGAHPLYGWADNKGYGSAEHVAALRVHGPSRLHRQSWRLPVDHPDAAADD